MTVLIALSCVGTSVTGASATPYTDGGVQPGDLTGDSIDDRITLGAMVSARCPVTTEAGLAGGGFGPPVTVIYPNSHTATCPDIGVIMDVTGTGRKDLVLAWTQGSGHAEYPTFIVNGSTVIGTLGGLLRPTRMGTGVRFNTDSLPDLWMYSATEGRFQNYHANPATGLEPGVISFCDTSGDPHLEIFDLDDNGRHDVLAETVCGNENSVAMIHGWTGRRTVLAQGGPGRFTASLVNYNNDALPDVIVERDSTATYFVNRGRGNFDQSNIHMNRPPGAAVVPAGAVLAATGFHAADSPEIESIQVSTDGGTSWHRAAGKRHWTYEWQVPDTTGPAQLMVRTMNRNGVPGPPLVRSVTVQPARGCPCTVLGDAVPEGTQEADAGWHQLGMRFRPSVNALVTGVRFYKGPGSAGLHRGLLWSPAGVKLAEGAFVNETPSGWQTMSFPEPVPISAGTTYVVSYMTYEGRYSYTPGYFTEHRAGTAPVYAPPSPVVNGNGVFSQGDAYPWVFPGDVNFWVDVVMETDGADTVGPAVLDRAPAVGATDAPTESAIAVTFDSDLDPTADVHLRTAAGDEVLGTWLIDGPEIQFLPHTRLIPNTTYTVTFAVADRLISLPSPAVTWSFTTGADRPGCPCTILHNRRPEVASAADPGDVELGVKFVTEEPVMARGVRFYKGANNSGTHTGSLWSSAGQRLAHGTFTNETASGWQRMTFAEPVQLAPGNTYVVSYRAPRGHYTASPGYLLNDVGWGSITAPRASAVGGNGVYQYGGGFPSQVSNGTNYWVDVIADAEGVDTVAPSVTAHSPSAGATGVPVGASVSANFDEAVESDIEVSLTYASGSMPLVWQFDPDRRRVVFGPQDPYLLLPDTTYTASVRARDRQGNVRPATTWQFTTAAAGSCPCSLQPEVWAPATDTGAPVEVGIRWHADTPGTVTAVRFFKPLGDPGTHTGTLWSPSGVALATGTFTGETASGWQTLVLDTPVPVAAGVDHVVSVHSSAGRYGYVGAALAADHVRGPLTAPANTLMVPNGVYRYGDGGVVPANSGGGTYYGVDVVFTR